MELNYHTFVMYLVNLYLLEKKLPQATGNQYNIPGGSVGEITSINNKQASKNKYNAEREKRKENK